MSPRRTAAGRARAVKATIALAVASACLGAVAYAATRPGGAAGLAASKPIGAAPHHGPGTPQGSGEERLLQPRFIEYPEVTSSLSAAQFRFHVPPRSQRPRPLPSGPPGGEPTPPRRFQCRLDNGGWKACSSPYRLNGLAPGGHAFAVRAFNRAGHPGPTLSYSWRYVEPSRQEQVVDVDPKPFSIEQRGELEPLYPGWPAQQVSTLVTNPNPVSIEVTSLIVSVAGDPPSCPAENFSLTPSSASPSAPLTVPAGGSVILPTTTTSAPSIVMLNLPVNQDACRGVEVPLVFNGEAHG